MFGVQFITHHTDTITYLDSVRIALEGGCRWIQLRMKEASDTQAEEVARQALALVPCCRSGIHHRRPRGAGRQTACRRRASRQGRTCR